MKKLTLLFILVSTAIFSQTGPWQSPLHIRTSTNGTTFGSPTVFQDSSGVASLIRIGSTSSDTLMAAFQWFPAPKFSTYWDKIAVKFSYDGGVTWTAPKSCTFTGMPINYQRPFDPSLVQLSSGQIRMYFSSGLNMPPPGGIDTWSAISNDGINYIFEAGVKFDDATKHAIDPAVIDFGGTFYYTSWSSVTADGAYRAVSNNGTSFTTQTTYTFDGSHLWLGNYIVDGSNLKFYGSGSPGSVWFNTSPNGITWTGYTNTNVMNGADPAIVKNKAGTYVLIVTGPPAVTGIPENISESGIMIFPNSFSHHINIKNELNEFLSVEITDISGKIVYQGKTEKGTETTKVYLSHLSNGVYSCRVSGSGRNLTRKLIKTD